MFSSSQGFDPFDALVEESREGGAGSPLQPTKKANTGERPLSFLLCSRFFSRVWFPSLCKDFGSRSSYCRRGGGGGAFMPVGGGGPAIVNMHTIIRVFLLFNQRYLYGYRMYFPNPHPSRAAPRPRPREDIPPSRLDAIMSRTDEDLPPLAANKRAAAAQKIVNVSTLLEEVGESAALLRYFIFFFCTRCAELVVNLPLKS